MAAFAYTGPSAFEMLPVLWAYAGWIAITAVFFALGMSTCAANSGPLAPDPQSNSMFRSELEGESKFRETYKARFGSQEITYVLLLNGAAGVLLWFADAGKLWAAGILTVLSLWLVYSHARSPFTLRQMNPRLVDSADWAYYLGGALLWVYIAGCIVLRWHAKL
jgi:hypothetical protein